jgi:hypothetical protein
MLINKANTIKNKVRRRLLDLLGGTARGTVSMILKDGEGNIMDRPGDHNLIIKMGRKEIIKKLAGQSTVSGISKCGVGKNNTPAAADDTGCKTLILLKSIDPGNITMDLNAVNPMVSFKTIFTGAEVNDDVVELALQFSDTVAFARYVNSSIIPLKGSLSLEVVWTIEF